MRFLKEIFYIFKYIIFTPKRNKTIIFYAEHKDYYPYLEGLINELTNHSKLNITYITSDPKDPILKVKHPLIDPFYIEFLLPFFLACVNCKIFIITLTELDQYHLKKSINKVFYVYAFHSITSLHNYTPHAFDAYDSILCVGPHHINEFQTYNSLYNLKPKTLIEAGYYRIERIYTSYKTFLPKKQYKNKTVILIAPTWSKNTIFEYCGADLIQELLKNNYYVIARPHPETIRRNPKLIEALNSDFSKNPNFMLERTVASDESILSADVLISDFSGIVFEYTFGTERPVLFFDIPFIPRNKDLAGEPIEIALRKELGLIISPDKMYLIQEKIEELLREKLTYKERIIQLRNQYIFNFGKSSTYGSKHIIDVLQKV